MGKLDELLKINDMLRTENTRLQEDNERLDTINFRRSKESLEQMYLFIIELKRDLCVKCSNRRTNTCGNCILALRDNYEEYHSEDE